MSARWPRQGFKSPLAAADGRIIHNAGGSEAQELAYALAVAVAYLRALEGAGIPLDAARGMIEFRLAADADQFLTIAKFRALRALWARVEQACGLDAEARVHLRRDRLAHDDPARSVGEHAAHHHRRVLGRHRRRRCAWPCCRSRRRSACPTASRAAIARNTQLLLLEESNIAKVADPAAGSGGIEDLTGQALPRRLDAVPGDRGGRRRAGGAGARTDPGEGRKGPRRARGRDRAPQGCADRHQRLPESCRGAGAGARR